MKPSGHEAGHGTMSHFNWVNHIVGYILHTVRHASSASPMTTDSCSVNAQFLLVPYYSWRSTHHAHHVSSLSFPNFSALSNGCSRKQLCLLNGTRIMFLGRVRIICFHRPPRLILQIITIFLRKLPYIHFFGCSPCKLSDGNFIY